VAGIAADVIAAHPTWTPNQVKGALTYNSGKLDANGDPIANLRRTGDGSWEVDADAAVGATPNELVSNGGLVPSTFIDPATGLIDETRASWRRASWKAADGSLQATWAATSWLAVDPLTTSTTADATTERASWRRASWKTFFGDTPSQSGELAGGTSGKSGR
jgi:hypothetical protein